MNEVLANIIGSLMIASLLGVIVMVLVMITQAIFAVRLRCLRRGLAKVLFAARQPDAAEDVSDDTLMRYCRNDAALAIESCFPGTGSTWVRFGRIFGAGFGQLDRRVLSGAIRKLFPDIRAIAPNVANRFGRLAPRLKARLQQTTHVITLIWAVVVSIIYYLDPTIFWTTGSGESGLSTLPLLKSLLPTYAFGSANSPVVSVILTSILVAVVASLLIALFGCREDLVSNTKLDEPPDVKDECKPTIGREGCAVRAINFAGGGFDSIMQLGVTHALMVIQGRPPDAVVGLSTGAIPAAALAEVLQAGDAKEADYAGALWKDLKSEQQLKLQSQRMQARVHRFRSFENAAYQARERLYDALTPDAYQVDSNDPLMPLKTPFFQTEERQHKIASLSTKSGLIRLYNDVLALNIPFGTLVRVLRRVLGFLAAGEIQKPSIRYALRVLEFNRIWLLIGSNLREVARLFPVLVAPIFKIRSRVRPLSAGSLIFQFPINRVPGPAVLHAAVFLILLVFWLGGSLLPVAIMFLPVLWESPLAWPSVTVYVAAASLAFFATYKFDATNLRDAVRDNRLAIVQFLWLTVKLLSTLILVLAAASLLFESVQLALSYGRDETVLFSGFRELATGVVLWTLYLLAAGAAVFSVVALIVIVLFVSTRVSAKFRHVRETFSFGGWYLHKFLQSYNLEKSLLHTYDLRSFLIELFDREYYGKTDLNDVVSDSLRDRMQRSSKHFPARKKVADYRGDHHVAKIHVGIAAANVLTGNLETIPDKETVVDSIEAAMAIVPLYPASPIGGSIYVNGTNVANVPARAMTAFLRNRVNPKSGAVHLYSVSPFPISHSSLEDEEHGDKPYVHLWDIVKRALRLQRHRDAQLEQKLTELYTHVIPERNARNELQNHIVVEREKGTSSFTRVWVTPIESNKPLNVNKRILLASKDEQRRVVAETIADGCRASLEMMIRPSIRAIHYNGTAPCAKAVLKHFESQEKSASLKMDLASMALPGSDSIFGPGLREICERCALNRDKEKKAEKLQGHLLLNATLKVERPAWPHERAQVDESLDDDATIKQRVKDFETTLVKQYSQIKGWPASRGISSGAPKTSAHPTISLLFSGGVFRGVFQMGVLNALNELRVQPDLIAGASIGSITAAMVARVFSMENDLPIHDGKIARPKRHRQIARLSAVYLAVDRLILTDRFADFVRNLTIRASRIGFSMRQADHFFRKYDHPRSGEFDRLARKVLAGLERLFYINPYQLNDLVKSLRKEDDAAFVAYLREYTQQWLQRMDIGVETLGAEPLQQLIEHFVIPEEYSNDKQRTPFRVFSSNAMQFLATATNLQKGKLEIIGEPPEDPAKGSDDELLMEALLVSSAFPGVFRPRWSWDLHPGTTTKSQYIDGGVLDNLPIEPVFDFLNGAQAAGLLTRRPTNADGSAVPHLMFAASLEADTPQLVYRDQWQLFQDYWPSLLTRTKELRYNTKADIYRNAERNLRAIYNTAYDEADGDPARFHPLIEPLDVEVVTVKPKWLCNTFGFHPMLGFRRKNQARSIAHGCAATLLRFAVVEKNLLEGWGVDLDQLPKSKTFGEARRAWVESKGSASPDCCWLRPDVPCPFAESRLHELNGRLRSGGNEDLIDLHTIGELSQIHTFCKEKKTHRPE